MSGDSFGLYFLQMNIFYDQFGMRIFHKVIVFFLSLLHWFQTLYLLRSHSDSRLSELSNIVRRKSAIFSKEIDDGPLLGAILLNEVRLLVTKRSCDKVFKANLFAVFHFIWVLYNWFKNIVSLVAILLFLLITKSHRHRIKLFIYFD